MAGVGERRHSTAMARGRKGTVLRRAERDDDGVVHSGFKRNPDRRNSVGVVSGSASFRRCRRQQAAIYRFAGRPLLGEPGPRNLQHSDHAGPQLASGSVIGEAKWLFPREVGVCATGSPVRATICLRGARHKALSDPDRFLLTAFATRGTNFRIFTTIRTGSANTNTVKADEGGPI